MIDAPLVPTLMLVTNRKAAKFSLPELCRRAALGGVDAIQVREKDLDSEALLDLTGQIISAVGGRAQVIVNGDLDVAQQLGIGCHLPEAGPSITAARAVIATSASLGRSVHDVGSARDSDGCDYLIAGHVYPTASKPGMPPIGLHRLRAIVQAAPCPVLAIGGIEVERVAEVLDAGAYGIAVRSAINDAADPAAAARALRRTIESVQGRTMIHRPDQSLTLAVNGKPVEIAPGTTVSQFLDSKDLRAKLVVVELNGTILERGAFDSTVLNAGDRVEIVHFVGGG